MLRDETSVSRTRSPGVQAAMIAALLMAGLAVAGLRGTSGGRAAAAGEPATSAKAVAQAQDTPRTKPAESGKGNLPGAPPPVRTGSSKAGSDGSNGESGSSATSVEPFSLAYVPRDAVAVAALRPAQLLKHPALAVAKNVLSQQRELQQSLGVSPERIEQVIGVFVLDLPANGGPFRGPVPAGAIVHLTEARDALAMIQALQPNPEEQEYGGSKYVRDKTGTGLVCLLADERTVVVCSGEDHMRRLIVAGKTGASKAKWGDSWKEGKHADAAVLVNMAPLNELLKREIPQGDVSSRNTLLSFGPLWQGTSTGLLTANFGEKLKLGLLLKTKSLDDGKQVKATLEAAITLGQNSLSQTRTMISRQAGNEGAFLLGLIDTVDALIDSIEITQSFDTNQVSATAVVDLDEAPKLFAMLLPAVATARQAAARTQSINNLKQLGLAMHNYAQVNNSFPPAVLYGPDGKTPYSWRVAILPYLDQSALYEQYKKDEPWDSPNNKLVLAKMPALFRDPGAPADSTNSSYFAVTGPATIFSGKEGAKFADITDGMSNTLMLVEAKRDIPWTKPEDIPYPAAAPGGPAGGITNGQPEKSKTKDAPEAVDAPLPKLGGHYADIFLAAMCDGSVRAFPQKINPIILRSMLTRAAGEAIDWSTVNDPGAAKNP